MIAVTRFGRPVFGLIFDPVGQDVIWADIDTPTTWEPRAGLPRRLRARRSRTLAETMGYIELAFMPPDQRRVASDACLGLAHATTLRCSAHQYRLLAQGAVDFVLAVKLNPWDHAAGVLICRQAGGHAALLDGTPYDTSIDRGYLLSAGDRETWDRLAAHFSALRSEGA